MSPLRKVIKMKLATDSQIYIKIKSVIISVICGSFVSRFQIIVFSEWTQGINYSNLK